MAEKKEKEEDIVEISSEEEEDNDANVIDYNEFKTMVKNSSKIEEVQKQLLDQGAKLEDMYKHLKIELADIKKKMPPKTPKTSNRQSLRISTNLKKVPIPQPQEVDNKTIQQETKKTTEKSTTTKKKYIGLE